MLALGATTAGLSTGAEDLCDSASTHVTELSDLAKDGFALGQVWGKQVWHGRSSPLIVTILSEHRASHAPFQIYLLS